MYESLATPMFCQYFEMDFRLLILNENISNKSLLLFFNFQTKFNTFIFDLKTETVFVVVSNWLQIANKLLTIFFLFLITFKWTHFCLCKWMSVLSRLNFSGRNFLNRFYFLKNVLIERKNIYKKKYIERRRLQCK